MDHLKVEYQASLGEDKRKELEKEKSPEKVKTELCSKQTRPTRATRDRFSSPPNPWGYQKGLSSGLQDHGRI